MSPFAGRRNDKLLSYYLEQFRICCRLPCPILFRVFCGNGWETKEIPLYTISENALERNQSWCIPKRCIQVDASTSEWRPSTRFIRI